MYSFFWTSGFQFWSESKFCVHTHHLSCASKANFCIEYYNMVLNSDVFICASNPGPQVLSLMLCIFNSLSWESRVQTLMNPWKMKEHTKIIIRLSFKLFLQGKEFKTEKSNCCLYKFQYGQFFFTQSMILYNRTWYKLTIIFLIKWIFHEALSITMSIFNSIINRNTQ